MSLRPVRRSRCADHDRPRGVSIDARPVPASESRVHAHRAAGFVGCAGTATGPANTVGLGPHRGRLLRLPDDAGFAEVVVESAGKSPKSAITEVAAYFFGPDARAPLAPPPADVAVSLYLAEAKERRTVPLKPASKDGDPASSGRFAAVPPPGFDGVIVSGRLSAKLGGRDIDVVF